MCGEIREWWTSHRSITELHMCKREEVEEVKESNEKDVGGGEEEIRMQKQYQHRLLSRYEETSRLFNDKWLFIVLNPSLVALSEVS